MDTVELVLEIEEEFEITISNHDLAECATMGQLGDIVRKELLAANRTFDSFETWQRLARIVSHTTGVPQDKLQPDMNFADDLQMG